MIEQPDGVPICDDAYREDSSESRLRNTVTIINHIKEVEMNMKERGLA